MKKILLAVKHMLRKGEVNTRSAKFPTCVLNLNAMARILLLVAAAFFCIHIYAQPADAGYQQVIRERSAKIVNTLGITDSGNYQKVLDELSAQYAAINAIHDGAKNAIAGIKGRQASKEEIASAIRAVEEEKTTRLTQRHAEFIAHLKGWLSEDQLEKVKDGMTYRVFPITYDAYLDMLPNLSVEQRQTIYNWLKEAREIAMDQGSSDDKHKVFGKYKGRINNYLSAAGYDLKKETEAWQKRIKDRQGTR